MAIAQERMHPKPQQNPQRRELGDMRMQRSREHLLVTPGLCSELVTSALYPCHFLEFPNSSERGSW